MTRGEKIRPLVAIGAALFLTPFAPALAVAALAGISNAGQMLLLMRAGYMVALVHLVLFGFPLFLMARHARRVTIVSSSVAGAVIGCVPTALLTLGTTNYASFNDVVLAENGVRTLAGWLRYGQIVAGATAFGALSGVMFWLIAKSIGGRSALESPL